MTQLIDNQDPPQRLTIPFEEARLLVGVGRNTMYRLLNNGTIRCVRAGRKILIPLSAIEEFINGKH
ncbi:hypothetical protein DAETH_10080 [Deinococcus aetherius]|uniref:Helix-turn-helix domain-containing protein n=2 Tax=Deinococcus aetherius TaxID=200252 RepID=A0ABM8ABA2_9DEIO|nr:hypothetical protein DAETH_10080 [Deinococcus aetherius]